MCKHLGTVGWPTLRAYVETSKGDASVVNLIAMQLPTYIASSQLNFMEGLIKTGRLALISDLFL